MTTGGTNIGLGRMAGQYLTTSQNNFYAGNYTAKYHRGGHNVAIGPNALYGGDTGTCANNTGSYNVALGYQAGKMNTSGTANIYLGYNAGPSNAASTGSCNIFMGWDSGDAFTSGSHNIVMGHDAGRCISNNDNNVFIGKSAGCKATSSGNTMIGYNAGGAQTTGAGNVYIGCGAPENDGTSNEVIIYDGANYARFQGSDTSWSFTSDERDKQNVQDLLLGLSFINTLKPRQFEWQWRTGSGAGNGTIRSGFIAQEILESTDAAGLSRTADESITSKNVYTGLVDITNPDQYQVSTGELVPMLVKAVQELSAKNDALEARIAALESS